MSEALAGTAGMRFASRSSAYVLGLWGGTTLGTAVTTALAFHFVSDLGPQATAVLKAFGAGALIAMAAFGNHDPGGIPQWTPLFRRPRCCRFRSSHTSRRTRGVSLVQLR